jgi:transposase
MRNGFNGLAAKVQTTLKDDPMSGHVFIFRAAAAVRLNFCGPPATGCAADQTAGARRFAWPSARDGKVFLTPAQLAMLRHRLAEPKRPDLLTMLWCLFILVDAE